MQVSIGSSLIFSMTASLDQSLCLNKDSANARDTDNVSAISKMSCSLASCKSCNERFLTNSLGFSKVFLSERFCFDSRKSLNYVCNNSF